MVLRSMLRLMLAGIVLAVVSGSVAGCDKIFCHNECPQGQTHDTFCGCGSFGQKTGTATPAGSALLYSNCICGEEDPPRDAIAYFRSKPGQYGKGNNSRLRLTSSKCEDLVACPNVSSTAQVKQYVLTGETDINVSNWGTTTNLVTGGVVYSVEGPIIPAESSINEDHGDPVPTFAALENFSASALAGVLTGSTATVAASDKALDCHTECDPHNPSPLCEVGPAPSGTAGSLRQLKARLAGVSSTSIPAKQLLSMFGEATDDCLRGNTEVDNGHLVNRGRGECFIRTRLPQMGVNVTIKVPAVLSGDIRSPSADGVVVAFPTQTEAATVTLSNRDLNNRFGGQIKFIDADSNEIRFSMRHACIAVSLN